MSSFRNLPSNEQEFMFAAKYVLNQAKNFITDRVGDKDEIQSNMNQLQTVINLHIAPSNPILGTIINSNFENIRKQIEQTEHHHFNNNQRTYQAIAPKQYEQEPVHTVHTGHVGPPHIAIEEAKLKSLLQDGLSAKEIGDVFQVSESTIRRRVAELNEGDEDCVFNVGRNISPDQIDELVCKVKNQFKNWGIDNVRWGIINTFGITISKAKIGESLKRVDPIGYTTRWSRAVKRRRYRVPGPSSLWHLDTNHKLIDWRIIIFGCVDGYSRLPVILKANDNNKAETWLNYFVSAINKWGVPERARGDYGMENIQVARLMEAIGADNGQCQKRFIYGRSVHNQRIERFWRDVNVVTVAFFDIFIHMQQYCQLDKDDEIHIYALHVVFMNRIQARLDTFAKLYAHKPLRTTRRSPYEMFTEDEKRTTRLDDSEYFLDDELNRTQPRYINDVQIPTKLDIPRDIVTEVVSQIEWQGWFDGMRNDEDGIGLWIDCVQLLNQKIDIQVD
eukprot:175683_1